LTTVTDGSVTDGFFPGMNTLGYEGDPPFNYEFGNEWNYNSPFICVFIAWFLFEHENNLPIYFYMR
jgi:hypothetical protein